MTQLEADAVRATIQRYLDGTRTGNLELVKQTFHPEAKMCGYLQGRLLVGGPEPFYDAVSNAPSPVKSGEPYEAKLSKLEIAGPAASVTVDEGPYLGMHFTNYFHLLKVDGDWKIVSKTFSHR
ncbi:nuclear transport factor 2 family protein [Steroidobacter sp.]|uniref:nuclear transport factor 2 family protein n=1 Tax=Steroidobacter sp. TaxID=1978227 RepID=UPI001A5F1BF7|nr:nuclear transport factor 2 family protein [Steroidobacter sp.]MBL8269233.1 nuclear transport factor 2 family protein [Steroidobacter sp.]